MAGLDTLDLIVLAVLLSGTVAYFTKGKYWAVLKDPYAQSFVNQNGSKAGKTRNIVEKMADSGKNCVILYGSQTGTAEDYASRLAKEGKSRFGLETMVADLEDYDYDNLDVISNDKVVMFILATYGEGEPTDNAVDFYEFIKNEDAVFSTGQEPPLGSLSYVMFGLGNNTYEHFNAIVRRVNGALEKLGAHRIGHVGEGDDGAGTMEEDFLAWKEPMWASLAQQMGLHEREAIYEPDFAIVDRDGLTTDSPDVYLGEPNKMYLAGTVRGPFNAHNPYIAPIVESRELYSVQDRNCMHLEIDIGGSSLTYQTGDHIAIWPMNPGDEVERFLGVLGLLAKRHDVIGIKALEPTAKVPFPTPTTYDAVVRYHLEICAPVSRQFLTTLAAFAPDDKTKKEITKLGGDKDYFQDMTSSRFYNIARLLDTIGKGQMWTKIPFSAFLEGINKLQPRYYSISSSSLMQPKKVAVTAVVECQQVVGREDPFRGVATNYLFALKLKQNSNGQSPALGLDYKLSGPRDRYDGIRVPVHVRHSNFKLPSDPSTPIIMVGPGSGVAPFRGFLGDRVKQAQDGIEIGRSLLFFGCRKRDQDFLYKDEMEERRQILGDKFELITAFSREGAHKVYVQHRLKERAEDVNRLLEQQGYFYVCGDAANMAREVNAVLVQIIAQQRGIPETKAEAIVKSMRASNQYQEDVWS